MGDISNRSLAALLVVAIVVSVAGSWMVMTRGPGLLSITGRQSDTGTASVTITTNASLQFSVNTVSWGTGYIDTGTATNCNLNTSGGVSAGCVGFTAVSNPLEVENNGNQNLSVTINFSKNSASFIGGAGGYSRFMVSDNESNSCPGGIVFASSWAMLSTSNVEVCASLLPVDTADSLDIDMEVNIVIGTTADAKSVIVTATGTAV